MTLANGSGANGDGAGDRRLWRAATTLGRTRAYGKGLPVVWFVTDPDRTPDPVSIAERLATGAGVIYRHFGGTGAAHVARQLAEVAARRGLVLLIGADAALAAEVGAAGVHLPERDAGLARELKTQRPGWLITAAAHSRAAAHHALANGADGVLLSPVFPSRSASAGVSLGPHRLARVVRHARGPIYALGGVNTGTVHRLIGTGVAGFAAVEAFSEA